MTQDATSDPPENTGTASATEDDPQTQQTPDDATARPAVPGDAPGADKSAERTADQPQDDDDKLGDSGKRALASERKSRRDAERQLTELRARLQTFEDRDKTELQRAIERAEAAEKGAGDMRVANARLMAAATYNLHPDLIELLGTGTDEEIEARAKLLSERLTAAAPPEPAKQPRPSPRRPVESLTPGARPANEAPADPNDAFRDFLNARRT